MKRISNCPDQKCLATNPTVDALSDAERAHLPPDILARKGPEDSTLICRYCCFVWFSPPPDPFIQRSPAPAGYLENDRFVAVPMHHPLKRAP